MVSDTENKQTFVYFYNIFYKNKKPIFLFTLALMFLTIFIVYFVLDPIFMSSTIVKTSNKSGASGLSSLIGEGMPDLSDFSGLSGGTSSKELALYEEILNSRRTIEETILKFKLNDEWQFKYFNDAIKNFRENVMEIKKNKIAGTMEINIYDKKPERAKEIAEFVIYQLNKINSELNVQNAKSNREFIEKRYLLAKEQLKYAEDSITTYQNIYGLAPDVVAKASVQGELQLETQIKSEEIKLDILNKILSPNQTEIQLQQEKIALLKQQLNDIKNSSDISSPLNLKGKPQIIIDYFRLQRNVEIQNKILLFILPLYEQAKIEENKEMPSVTILDQPNIPESKVKPKRVITTFVSILIGIFFSYGFFIFKDKYTKFSKAIKNKQLNE